MKENIIFKIFSVVFITLLGFVLGDGTASTEIVCDGTKVDKLLDDFFSSKFKDYSAEGISCTINVGEGNIFFPVTSTDPVKKNYPNYAITNIKGSFKIVGKGVDKTFFECPDSNKKTIFSISGSSDITFENLSFRNCGEKKSALSAIKVIIRIIYILR